MGEREREGGRGRGRGRGREGATQLEYCNNHGPERRLINNDDSRVITARAIVYALTYLLLDVLVRGSFRHCSYAVLCMPSCAHCCLFHWFLGQCFLVEVHPYMTGYLHFLAKCIFCNLDIII